MGSNLLSYDIADDINSKYLANAAGINLAAGLSYNITSSLSVSIDGNYRSRDISEEQQNEFKLSNQYFVADLMLSYTFDYVQLELTAKNIFDESYSDILGVELPGRWVMLQIKFIDL